MGQAAFADDNLVEDEENPEESWGEIVMLSTRSYTVHVCGKRQESWGYPLAGNSPSPIVRIFRKEVYDRQFQKVVISPKAVLLVITLFEI